ncbi:hypothetical protein ACNO6Z_06155 [Aliarcobacter lanthieri]|uniref:hypothetical protein n=1 Tax=Aliarcobacter lanthieri TaxID=1355374 RepID=UPI003AA7DFAA
MEEIRKIQYTRHFTKQHHDKILEQSHTFIYQYHLVITYKNIKTQRDLFKSLFKNDINLKTYNYACYNKKGYTKANKLSNRHKGKIHTHSLILSKYQLEIEDIIDISKFKDCDIKLVKVYSHLNDVIAYIFDGHHSVLSNSNKYSFAISEVVTDKTTQLQNTKTTISTNLTLRQKISLLMISDVNRINTILRI